MNLKITSIGIVFIILSVPTALVAREKQTKKTFQATNDPGAVEKYVLPDKNTGIYKRTSKNPKTPVPKEEQSEKRLHFYQKRSNYFQQRNQVDSALKYSQKAAEAALDLGKKDLWSQQLTAWASLFSQNGNYRAADSLLQKAADYYSQINDSIALGQTFLQSGNMLLKSEDYENALEKFYRALENLNHSSQYLQLGNVYKNIATINIQLGHEERVSENLERAIKYYTWAKDSVELAGALVNIGVSYKNLDHYEKAISYYHKSLAIANAIGHYTLMAQNYMNMANLYDLSGKRDKALEYHKKSLDICRQQEIPIGIYLNNINLGEINLQEEQYGDAIDYLTAALEIGEANEYGQKVPLYENLFYAWKQAGNSTKALHYLEKAHTLKDSLSRAQKHKEIMELQTQYETQKKEADILRLQKAQQEQHIKQTYLLGGAATGLLSMLFLLFYIQQKRKNEKKNTLLALKENEKIKEHLEARKKELVAKSMHISQMQDFSALMVEKINALEPHIRKTGQPNLNNLRNLAKRSQNNKREWNEFDRRFRELNNDFIQRLTRDYPQLTPSEIRICSFIYLDMTTKEMATVTNRSERTISNLRYRIRKKLNLDAHANIYNFMHSV